MSTHSLRLASLATSSLVLVGLSLDASAQFTVDPSAPSDVWSTENVDFADVDLDGDFDAVFACGGDPGPQQNRIWINQGGLQGGVEGDFLDDTAARLPASMDTSRDVEFADIDGDGDFDLHVSNTSSGAASEGNRWWVNQGGLQPGTAGFYVDETAARWVGLNAPGTSIAASLLLPNSVNPVTFLDWAHDSDFADLDNDGDLDLVHSAYGSGGVPTRLFLNDGDGRFQEFNPSGVQLASSAIPNGTPGLWADGVQQANTTASDGSACDIATDCKDVELGDIDGDMDIDLMLGALGGKPRMFFNRLEEAGSLQFRDVTSVVFFQSGPSGGNCFEQELGDLDNDNDLDLYGLNWWTFDDVYIRNNGNGKYPGGQTSVLPDSEADDEEGDWLDYDQDGDLDLFVASFSGENRLYRNRLDEGALPSQYFVLEASGLGDGTSKDADAADVDGDGDDDLIVANRSQSDVLLRNTTNIPDTTPARVVSLEGYPGGAAGPGVVPIRVAVYDNAPYYQQYFNRTELHVEVDGVALPALGMSSSGGQIFRGELPVNLVGSVEYFATSRDRLGNVGTSAPQSYTSTGDVGVTNGGTTPSSVGTPSVRSLVEPIAGSSLHVLTEGVAPGALGFLLVSPDFLPTLNLGDGIKLNLLPSSIEPVALVADPAGRTLTSVASTPPAWSGLRLYFQYLAADGVGVTWASSNRLALRFD